MLILILMQYRNIVIACGETLAKRWITIVTIFFFIWRKEVSNVQCSKWTFVLLFLAIAFLTTCILSSFYYIVSHVSKPTSPSIARYFWMVRCIPSPFCMLCIMLCIATIVCKRTYWLEPRSLKEVHWGMATWCRSWPGNIDRISNSMN